MDRLVRLLVWDRLVRSIILNGKGDNWVIGIKLLTIWLSRGGMFRGGMFRGGMFREGMFWEGMFWEGMFWEGMFWEGMFRGGMFWGGIELLTEVKSGWYKLPNSTLSNSWRSGCDGGKLDIMAVSIRLLISEITGIGSSLLVQKFFFLLTNVINAGRVKK